MGKESDQELEEDGRTVVAAYRNSEDDRLHRIYFADATYLEIAGQEVLWEQGHAPEEGEVEPDWQVCDWQALPWRVREQVRACLEDAMRPHGERLAQDLLSHPYEEQCRLAAERPEFHEWSLAFAFLEKSQTVVDADPRKAVEFARVAERLTHFFSGYDSARVFELRARCWAHAANALRIAGERKGAEEAFREADLCLAQGGSADLRLVRAEILSLRASLLRDLRHFPEALALLKEARDLYEEEGASSRIVQVLQEQATLLEDMGDAEGAWKALREAERVRLS
jgi:tetratricopeptide (TPR) repeat protein